jgi:hypothetical protein
MSGFEGRVAFSDAALKMARDGGAAAAEAPVAVCADDGRGVERIAGRAVDWELPMSRD